MQNCLANCLPSTCGVRGLGYALSSVPSGCQHLQGTEPWSMVITPQLSVLVHPAALWCLAACPAKPQRCTTTSCNRTGDGLPQKNAALECRTKNTALLMLWHNAVDYFHFSVMLLRWGRSAQLAFQERSHSLSPKRVIASLYVCQPRSQEIIQLFAWLVFGDISLMSSQSSCVSTKTHIKWHEEGKE